MLAANSIRTPKIKLDKLEIITKQSDNNLKTKTNKIIKKKLVVQEKALEKKTINRPYSKHNLKVLLITHFYLLE